PNTRSPTIHRWVHVDFQGTVLAVGVTNEPVSRGLMAPPSSAPATSVTRSLASESAGASPLEPEAAGAEAAESAEPESASSRSADEGTRPIRFPSIDSDAAPKAGEPIRITVNLLREKSADTSGG